MGSAVAFGRALTTAAVVVAEDTLPDTETAIQDEVVDAWLAEDESHAAFQGLLSQSSLQSHRVPTGTTGWNTTSTTSAAATNAEL